MSEYIDIGKITTNQGNKGEVKVIPLTDFPKRFELLERVYLVKNDKKIKMNVEDVWFHKQFVILKFVGVDNIGEAIAYKDYMVKIPEKDLITLSPNQFYIYKIIGFKVYTTGGKKLGKLSEILPTGGTDIFLVKGCEKDYMIPASQEIITEINEDDNKIMIKPLPGLLDL